MLLLLLAACTNHRDDALEAEITELRATQAQQAEEIRDLQAKAAAWDSLMQVASNAGLGSGGAPEPPRETVPLEHYDGASEAILKSVAVTVADAQAMHDPAAFGALRAWPHAAPDGSTDGVRISGLRSDSLAARVGLKNGDVLQACRAGGGAWARLDTSDQLPRLSAAFAGSPTTVEIVITRRGELTLLRLIVA